jgi:hypothetical protein
MNTEKKKKDCEYHLGLPVNFLFSFSAHEGVGRKLRAQGVSQNQFRALEQRALYLLPEFFPLPPEKSNSEEETMRSQSSHSSQTT